MVKANILNVAENFSIKREDAILAAVRLISKVLGKESEFEDFVSYMNFAGKDQVPSSQDIASHTPTWVQLTLPALAKLYDTGFYYGQEFEALRHSSIKDKG